MHSKAQDRKNPKGSGLVLIALQSVDRDARQGKMRAPMKLLCFASQH
jgi:hypothetical protein